MSVEDKEKLTKQMNEQITKSFELDDFISYTLNSFAYRYIESETTGKIQTEKRSDFSFAVIGTETNFRAFQKTTHKPTLELLKARPKSVQMGILVEFNGDLKNGKCKALAFVGENGIQGDNFSVLEKTFCFDDILDLRNNFALYLEEICEVF